MATQERSSRTIAGQRVTLDVTLEPGDIFMHPDTWDLIEATRNAAAAKLKVQMQQANPMPHPAPAHHEEPHPQTDEKGFPKTVDGLLKVGYERKNRGLCNCGAAIEWFRTPKGKSIPLEVDGHGGAVAHWAHCPLAEQFRKKAEAKRG